MQLLHWGKRSWLKPKIYIRRSLDADSYTYLHAKNNLDAHALSLSLSFTPWFLCRIVLAASAGGGRDGCGRKRSIEMHYTKNWLSIFWQQ